MQTRAVRDWLRKRIGACLALALLLAACATPVATFVPIGYNYAPNAKQPDDILVFMKPNVPDRLYRVVGSIVVTPPSGDAALNDYIAFLKSKAAAIGVDGVVNVDAVARTMTSSSGGCIGGTPYYSQSSSTAYDLKGDAFVWTDSTAPPDTTMLPKGRLDSLQRSFSAEPDTDAPRLHWIPLAIMGGAIVGIVLFLALR